MFVADCGNAGETGNYPGIESHTRAMAKGDFHFAPARFAESESLQSERVRLSGATANDASAIYRHKAA
jgi:hypothetical protein